MRAKKLMSKQTRTEAGFTLIELMIVIAIIGILAAVAIPNFMRARDKAVYTKCLESLGGLKVAEEMYMTDNSKYAADVKYLAMYMIPGCTDPEGAGNNCDQLSARIGEACANSDDGENGESGGVAINMPDDYSFEIKGRAEERFECPICYTPTGFKPEKYQECPDLADYDCP